MYANLHAERTGNSNFMVVTETSEKNHIYDKEHFEINNKPLIFIIISIGVQIKVKIHLSETSPTITYSTRCSENM
jgi:hypothetical protein